jgi:hypothetical protein
VVKSASGQNKKSGDKVRRAPPANKPRVSAKPKLVLLDPPRAKQAAGAPARANASKQTPRNAPRASTNNQSAPNSARSRPTSLPRNQQAPRDSAPRAQAPRGKGSVSELTVALQTANSIAINRTHPKQAEVVELLRTHEKGWIDDTKFVQVLRGLAF